MSWDYAMAINSLTLSDVVTFATIEDEVPSPWNDPGVQIPGRHGVQFDSSAPFAPLVVTLRTHFRWTNAAGAITHADGEAGHIYENLSLLKRQLNVSAPVLTRTLPHIGDVRAVCKSNTPGFVGEQRHVYHFPLTVGSGSWQDATESSATGNPPTVITSGNRRIFDPRISLTAAGTYTIATASETYTITAVAGPTYPVTINVGTGAITASGGADASGSVSFSHEEWFQLAVDHTHVITGSCTVFWRNRWA